MYKDERAEEDTRVKKWREYILAKSNRLLKTFPYILQSMDGLYHET